MIRTNCLLAVACCALHALVGCDFGLKNSGGGGSQPTQVVPIGLEGLWQADWSAGTRLSLRLIPDGSSLRIECLSLPWAAWSVAPDPSRVPVAIRNWLATWSLRLNSHAAGGLQVLQLGFSHWVGSDQVDGHGTLSTYDTSGSVLMQQEELEFTLLRHRTTASVTSYGPACPSGQALQLAPVGLPQIGTTFHVAQFALHCPALFDCVPALIVGLQQANTIVNHPSFATNGCSLLVTADFVLREGEGPLGIPIVIPDEPALIGSAFNVQGVRLYLASFGPNTIQFTDALHCEVGA